MFTGRTDIQHGRIRMNFFKFFITRFTQHADIFFSRQNFDFIIINIDIYPRFRLAFDNDSVPTGIFELSAPDTAGVWTCDHACKRWFGHNHITACRRRSCACHRSGNIDKFVVGRQRLDFCNAFFIKHRRSKSAAADKFLCQIQIYGFNSDLTCRQVDTSQFAHVRSFHTMPPSMSIRLTIR